MASMLSSQGVVLATAMAVSGTVILLAALRRQKTPFAFNPIPQDSQHSPRSCISTGERNREKTKKKKKKVHFAEDVVDPTGNSQEVRKYRVMTSGDGAADFEKSEMSPTVARGGGKRRNRGMPANRAALYSGILRDRGSHRLGCAY